jgi:glycosyltransferase involved in cell wall biosynthesis
LRWDFVWQRPQQILSRLAHNRPVLYVEEPIFLDDTRIGSLDITQPHTNVYRAVPRLRGELRTRPDDAARLTRTMVQTLIGEGGRFAGMFDNAIQWFYTPLPAPMMLGAFGEVGVVYDCMDELSQFRFAPPELVSSELTLLERADVVFTGGRKLYDSKSRHHPNVHFFGCGVDADHFSKARSESTPVARELRDLPHPILGYFGVIDERLDYALIQRLADSFENGSIVFVGPVVKVDPAELPKNPNVHWLGQRPYESLPEYVKGFDVCLMPFALNAATEYINPTKTLEYMAAGKPIVSTPVSDVVRNFTPIVQVAPSDEFIYAVTTARRVDPSRIEAGIARARNSTWESIVAAMDGLISRAVESKRPPKSARKVIDTSAAITA